MEKYLMGINLTVNCKKGFFARPLHEVSKLSLVPTPPLAVQFLDCMSHHENY